MQKKIEIELQKIHRQKQNLERRALRRSLSVVMDQYKTIVKQHYAHIPFSTRSARRPFSERVTRHELFGDPTQMRVSVKAEVRKVYLLGAVKNREIKKKLGFFHTPYTQRLLQGGVSFLQKRKSGGLFLGLRKGRDVTYPKGDGLFSLFVKEQEAVHAKAQKAVEEVLCSQTNW